MDSGNKPPRGSQAATRKHRVTASGDQAARQIAPKRAAPRNITALTLNFEG